MKTRSTFTDRDNIPLHLYQFLVVECRGLCALCHENIVATIHHIIPVAESGPTEYANLIPLCASCHAKVHKTQYDPSRLRSEKKRWVLQCSAVLTRIISSSARRYIRSRQMLKSFDAVDNVEDFLGFKDRLKSLLDRKEVFKNLFRVHYHRIQKTIDVEGSSHTSETQSFSSFKRLKCRQFHLLGDRDASNSEVDFQAAAFVRQRRTGVTTRLTHDEPRSKSYQVSFDTSVPANTAVGLRFSFYWPKTWDLDTDRYTYDVLGWAERVEYEMQFPDVVNIQAVTTTFVDVFGREWPNIGHAECLGAGFRWIGTRLPLFTRVIIRYTASVTG